MGIDVTWFDDTRRIILMTMQDPWTWEQNRQATETAFAMIDTVDGEAIIHFIVDLREASTLPANAISGFKYMAFVKHPREGNKYMVGVSPYLKRFGNAFRFIYPSVGKDYLFASSIEDAVKQIYALDNR